MHAVFYVSVFAWIAIIALSLSIFSTYWVPMIIGAVLVTLLAGLVASPRR